MKNTLNRVDAEVRPQSAKTLAPNDDAPLVMMTRAQLRELVSDAVIEALAEFKAGEQPAPDLLSGARMAEKLSISRSKLHFLRTDEGCPAVKVGDVFKFEPAAVMSWLRARSSK